MKDRQGLVGEAPGLEPGMILSAWNPDESWVHDALLRVNATKGVPTLELTVWSLVDVMVHPLGVHIHQQVANSLWVSYMYLAGIMLRHLQAVGPMRQLLLEHLLRKSRCRHDISAVMSCMRCKLISLQISLGAALT